MKTVHLLLIFLGALFISRAAEGAIYLDESHYLCFDGGTYTIDYNIESYGWGGYAAIYGDDTQVTMVDGGWVTGLDIGPGASFTMSGGVIEGTLGALGSKPILIYGGTIGNRIALDSGFPSGEDGDVYIYGTNFMIDGIPAKNGIYHVDGYISGILSNGDLLNCNITCAGANDYILAPAPEPATVGLLILGGLILRRKRK